MVIAFYTENKANSGLLIYIGGIIYVRNRRIYRKPSGSSDSVGRIV